MAHPEHERRIHSDIEPFNAWRRAHPGERLDLRGADLAGILLRPVVRSVDCEDGAYAEIVERWDLSAADLRQARLTGADLGRAILSGADLRGADLRGAELYETDLCDARFDGAFLAGATLVDADLRGAVFHDTNFALASASRTVSPTRRWTTLRGARCGHTCFLDVDLSHVEDLADVTHETRSLIDLRTFARSSRIPTGFLTGCGVPLEFIDALPAWIDALPRRPRCFLAFCREDKAVAEELDWLLEQRQISCWNFLQDARPGQPWPVNSAEAIERADGVVVLVSRHSLASLPVLEELQIVERMRPGERPPLLPVHLDAAARFWTHELAPRLRHVGGIDLSPPRGSASDLSAAADRLAEAIRTASAHAKARPRATEP